MRVWEFVIGVIAALLADTRSRDKLLSALLAIVGLALLSDDLRILVLGLCFLLYCLGHI